ncbi:MAG: pYEATS domain-containing protein [Candidatus Kapaibacterium sp.]
MNTEISSKIKKVFDAEISNSLTDINKHSEHYKSVKKKWILGLEIIQGIIVFVIFGSMYILPSLDHIGKPYINLFQGIGICLGTELCGMVIGFLFGIPKTSRALSERLEKLPGLTNNTNLEQISDWFTKLILGAALTQFPALFTFIRNCGLAFGPDNSYYQSFGVALMLFAFFSGFFLAFFFASLIHSHTLAAMFADQLDAVIENSSTKLEETVNNEVEMKSNDVANKKTALILTDTLSGDDDGEIEINVSNEVINESALDTPNYTPEKRIADDKKIRELASSIKPESFDFESDPWKGMFGNNNLQDNIKLSAKVTSDSPSLYRIDILICGDYDEVLPNGSLVVLFIHPTYNRYKRFVRVKNGKATLTIYSVGSFTIGALVNGGDTKLELNLAELPGVPKKFKDT